MYCLAIIIVASIPSIAQTTTDELSEQVEELSTSIDSLRDKLDKLSDNVVKFGLSIGYRELHPRFHNDFETASISPIDSTLQLQPLSEQAFLLSTSVVITPFAKSKWIDDTKAEIDEKRESQKDFPKDSSVYRRGLWAKKAFLEFVSNIGVQANINLVDFTSAQENFSFNRSIEGGLGLSYQLSERIYASAHYDLFFSRQLREHIKAREGQRIHDIEGNPILSIDQISLDDKDFYVTQSLLGFVYRVIIVF